MNKDHFEQLEKQLSAYHDGELADEHVHALGTALNDSPDLQKSRHEMQQLSAVFDNSPRYEMTPLQMARLHNVVSRAGDYVIYRTAQFASLAAALVLLVSSLAFISLSSPGGSLANGSAADPTWNIVMAMGETEPTDEPAEAQLAQWIIDELTTETLYE